MTHRRRLSDDRSGQPQCDDRCSLQTEDDR
jgi:hypothetical protein